MQPEPKEGIVIKKTRNGYKVVSDKSGRLLGGPYKTKEEAEARLREVRAYKYRKG